MVSRGGNTLLLSKARLFGGQMCHLCAVEYNLGAETRFGLVIEKDSPELIGSVKSALTRQEFKH